MKYTLTLAILVSAHIALYAKVRFIYIDKHINEASVIEQIKVLGYIGDSILLYRNMTSMDTMKIACKDKPYAESFRRSLIKSKYLKEDGMAGKWPNIGEIVLMILRKDGYIDLFAKKIRDDVRFWDPNSVPFANSIFMISRASVYRPVDNCRDVLGLDDSNEMSCEDGCVVSLSYLITYLQGRSEIKSQL